MNKNSIFFNHSFEKKRLKALISWIFNTFGEKEALRVVDELKVTGFTNATRAGLSIGLHDLITPPAKPLLISKAQVAMNKTDRDFRGGKITASERSQRIIDTWHRTSDTLRKQVVDHFNTYDQLNSVYIMALSGARGNFSQVRQLIGMRGLMADPQGQIISFPIRSNFREGLTLTEYFISCSGARKGLVDTALRTADTGYLTRRLVDVSHQVVIKRVSCNTFRGIVLKALQTGSSPGSTKILLPLKDRLIGRVLAEDIKVQSDAPEHTESVCKASHVIDDQDATLLATRDSEISPNLAFKISCLRDQVVVRSSLTCACTHEVCQLCYGWSLSQGKLVSLGEAVGVIAAQSIGEPGTQLTMRTFHTGGVFSGDLLQDIRAPHAGKVFFPQALQGLLVRNAQGQIAFLIKTPGVLLLDDGKSQVTRIQLEAATMVFVRQGQMIETDTIIGELAVMAKEGNQPIKSRQTLFAEFDGRVTHLRGTTLKVHTIEQELDWKFGEWQDEDNLFIERRVDQLRNGLRFIEPIQSISLGIIRILATRVGATESHLSSLQEQTRPNQRFLASSLNSPKSADDHTPTLVMTRHRRHRAGAHFGSAANMGGASPTVSGSSYNASITTTPEAPMVVMAGGSKSVKNQRVFPFLSLYKVRGQASDTGLNHHRWLWRGASAIDTSKTPSYVLNTIAEEGDLVDENYKDCISRVVQSTLER